MIFGGISTDTNEGEDRPKVFDDFHMMDLNDKFFASPFTANIRPSSRYGHAAASNIERPDMGDGKSSIIKGEMVEYTPELIILGG